MEYEERKLLGKICYLEDLLLRTRNTYEMDRLQYELRCLRKILQKIQWQRFERETHR